MKAARPLTVGLAALVAAGAAACGATPGGGNSAKTTAAPTGPVKTGIASLGNITLTVASAENDAGPKASLQQLAQEFHAKYPNVTVKMSFQAFDPFMKRVKLLASSDNPPDVFAGNQGYGTDGELVKAGLILPLDKYAKAYDWNGVFGEETLQQFKWTPDGRQFGQGSIYGASSAGEAVGLFYNAKKLKALGYDKVPDTLEQFDQVLAKAKAAGELPMQFGNQEGYPGIHIWGSVQGQFVDAQAVRDTIFGKPGADYLTPGNLQAAKKMVEWVQKGYFPKNVNGVSADTAGANFRKGQGVFQIAGTWATGDMKKNPDIRFANMPTGKTGKHVQTGSLSVPYHISAKSKNPDAAAAFIDFIVNKSAAKALIVNGRVPAAPTDEKAATPVETDTIEAWKTLSDDGGLALYPDWATNTMYDTMSAATQGVLGGKLSPQQFLDRLESDFKKFQSSRS